MTTSGRFWLIAKGKIDSMTLIGFVDTTPELARESGFLGVLDLLKVTKHGKGDNIYLIRAVRLLPQVCKWATP